jgi:peptidoglycan/xylan/chitin deacetylase (PgdA/CDA1 family)
LVSVGSHTHTHALLDRLPTERVVEELDRSIELIGDRLGVAARHFAYPKAVRGSGAAEAAVRARFVSAAVGGGHPNRYGRSDLHRLERTAIQRVDGLRWFGHKLAGGMAAEETLRRQVNRLRHARSRS